MDRFVDVWSTLVTHCRPMTELIIVATEFSVLYFAEWAHNRSGRLFQYGTQCTCSSAHAPCTPVTASHVIGHH